MRNLLLIPWLSMLVAFPTASIACSVGSYQVPTALELAERADAIVLARVDREIPNTEDERNGQLSLLPETLIAGEILPAEIRIGGSFGSDRHQPTKSDPNELAKANPDAFDGACNRYMFDGGMLLLLFLEKDPAGAFQVINSAFARTLEDVPNADSLWVRAVRYYAGVAKLPANARRGAMKAERDRLRSTRKPDDTILAADIDRQLRKKRTQNFD